ncbi:hypothetical protein J2X69_003639 [Algoriphagus sp. 4150]|uniref:hypothetical protein n=1 Tax=Algoriphagus sp. 4150 TaxID=2817756 RepID=UPI00286780E2|nr:hypothetical protein [Algoriphagus sp. 4150]MDR7131278.1 hypothetical protein [Algoriphagus sp. 4150]
MKNSQNSSSIEFIKKIQDITGLRISSNFDRNLIPVQYEKYDENTIVLKFEKNLAGPFFYKAEVRRYYKDTTYCIYSIKAKLIDEDGVDLTKTAIEIGNKIVRLYGEDHLGNEFISDVEGAEMTLGVWKGRTWLNVDKHPVKLLMEMDRSDFKITLFFD